MAGRNRLPLIGVAAALVCLPATVAALQRPPGAARVAPDFDMREHAQTTSPSPQATRPAHARNVQRARVRKSPVDGTSDQVRRARFDQAVDGLPVFGGYAAVEATEDGGVSADAPSTNPRLRGGIVGPEEAVRLAAGNVRAALDAFRPIVVRREPGPEQRTTMAAGPLRCEPVASLVYFPMDGQLRSAWHVTVEPEGVPDAYDIIVDARSGRILFRHNRARTWLTPVAH